MGGMSDKAKEDAMRKRRRVEERRTAVNRGSHSMDVRHVLVNVFSTGSLFFEVNVSTCWEDDSVSAAAAAQRLVMRFRFSNSRCDATLSVSLSVSLCLFVSLPLLLSFSLSFYLLLCLFLSLSTLLIS